MSTAFPNLRLSNSLALFFASAFQAFGIYHIHAPSGVTEGGVFGLTLLLQHWFGISPAWSSLILNGLCYFLGWRLLGKEFLAYSAISSLGYSLGYGLWEQFPPLWPDIRSYPLAASILGALFIGIGAGICIRFGGATCGDDALAMSLQSITNLPIQHIYLISDLTVLGLSLSYIPLHRIIYSLITVTLSGQIIGWIQMDPKKDGDCRTSLGDGSQ